MVKTQTPHIGRKIERIRTLRGVKQETLANQLGVTQAAISKMEQSETVDDEKLEKIAAILGVSVDTIKNFNEDSIVNLLNEIHNNHFDNQSIAFIYNQYNPIEKIVELYERLLIAEKEKNKLLEERLNSK